MLYKNGMSVVSRNSIFFIILFARSTFSRLCPSLKYDEVDWKKLSDLKATWHDVIENPLADKVIDCWDLHSFQPSANGFEVKIRQYVEGRSLDNMLNARIHFVSKGHGIYTANETHRSDFTRINKDALAHKYDKKEKDAVTLTNFMFDTEFFFVTDYKNYFIVAVCDPQRGLSVFIKNRTMKPDGQDMMNLWNLFIKNKQLPQGKMVLSDTCINRKASTGSGLSAKFKTLSRLSYIAFLVLVHLF